MPCSGATRFDPPPPPITVASTSHFADIHDSQVEYLVVVYNKENPRVLLSLRQAEILEALASDTSLAAKGGCVPALQDVPGTK